MTSRIIREFRVAEYRLTISHRATKEFEALPANVIERVRQKIRSLAYDPRPPGSKKLDGSLQHGPLVWRLANHDGV